jgi:hypothetical protein
MPHFDLSFMCPKHGILIKTNNGVAYVRLAIKSLYPIFQNQRALHYSSTKQERQACFG